MPLVSEVQEGRSPFGGGNDDVSSMTAIASVRTAVRDKLFPAEAAGSISTISGFDEDFCLINKHRGKPLAGGWRRVLGEETT